VALAGGRARNTNHDRAMKSESMERPAFRPGLVARVVPPDQVILLAETRQYFLTGDAYVALAEVMDGTRTRRDVLDAAAARVTLPRAMYALEQLVRNGYVGEAPATPAERTRRAWCDAIGVDAGVDGGFDVALHCIGTLVERAPFAESIAAAGLSVRHAGDEGRRDAPALQLVLTDDYLRPELAGLAARFAAEGSPWLLAKPAGTVLWMGPLFTPGAGPCWHCLSSRVRGNRQVEQYIERLASHEGPFVTTRAAAPHAVTLAAGLVTVAMQQWAGAGPPSRLQSALVTHDLLSWEQRSHAVVRRPQCEACGEPRLRDPSRRPERPSLVPRAKRFTSDGGHRTARPEETLQRLQHHVSSITGVVSSLDRLTAADAELAHSYNAGHNFAMITDDLFFLQRNLRGQSGGKGMTELQAKVSALCEAVERWSGVWRGDEPRVTTTAAALGREALPLQELLGFSERQYATRAEWNAAQPTSRQHIVPEPLPPDYPVDWTYAWSLGTGACRMVPAAYVYFGHPDLRRLFFCAADANGSAAGNTLEEAILQGLMEVVERDATAIWWYNRLRRPGIDLDAYGLPYISRLREYYASLGREFWALDLTTDLGIPVVAAVSRRTDRQPEDILIGLGAHLDPVTAMLRAITEMNQFLPAVAHTRPDGSTEYWFPDTDAHHWWRTATLDAEPWVAPDPARTPLRPRDLPSLATADLKDDVLGVVDRLAAAGMEAFVVDQTRPDVELHVAKVIVPGMRHFWRRLGPGRLYDVPVATGYLAAPTPEEMLNPWSIFF
jgi:oxazoline/thiazoline synthase